MATPLKKSTSIVLVESDQIIQHILPIKTFKVRIDTRHRGLKYTASSSVDKKRAVYDSSDDEKGCYEVDTLSPAVSSEESEFIPGKDIFQFKTHKRSGQMILKAQDSCSPGTPKAKQTSTARLSASQGRRAATPKSGQKTTSASNQQTPKQARRVTAVQEHKRVETSTPYRLRKRNLNLEQAPSSSDDSIDESSDDKEDDINDTSPQNPTNRATLETNMVAAAEAYFDLHSMAPITSDRTLSALDGPRMDVDTIREVLKQVNTGHQRELCTLMDTHTGLFNKWMLNLCCGYNILLHGLGSKRILMEKFREKKLAKFTHLVINGYFPSLTIKHILNSITEEILGSTKGFSNTYSQVEFIRDACKGRGEDFYLVIHNIDGVLLRSDKSQAALSLLSDIQGFHIIASVDHINAVLMWDQNRYFRFHWLWYETPTFLSYEAENSYENSLMVQQSGTLALSSTVHVMRSLTPNARQVFLLLANYQMKEADNPHYAGMSFQNLYHKCREAFLVNSDLTLQAQLVEFKDHRLIKSRKNFEGVEHLMIPLDKAVLKAVLQDHLDGHN